MRRRCLVFCLTFAALAPAATTYAEEPPPTLKTQKVTFKLVQEDSAIKGLDRTIELIRIPAGKIVLKGADGKDHEQTVKSIWVAKYETRWDEYNVFWMALDMTNEQWSALRERVQCDKTRQESGRWERPATPYSPPDGDFGIAGYPASCIHFHAAVRYCTWLSKLTGKKFRLPTDAEWEYACRAGGPPVKLNPKPLAEVAWFADNSDDKPHPVGKKRPNAWGLYDMLGNVGEYVIRDPKDDKGLIAGGTWSDEAGNVQSDSREPYSPRWQKQDPQDPQSTSWFDYDLHRIGFRVVMEE